MRHLNNEQTNFYGDSPLITIYIKDMENLKEINKDKINTPQHALIKTYNPEIIYLFGSYAWGNPDKDSDLDLMVILKETKEKKLHQRILKGRRALIFLDIPKDILVYTKNEFDDLASQIPTLCYKVKNEGVKLYEIV